MITPAYGLTATEKVSPKLALDFTTALLDPRITLTRALNTATRINASGFIEVVNADVPRFDFDPATLVCKGLLIEESRQNELLYSSTFDNAAWTTFSGGTGLTPVVTPNAGISPDGTNNAYRLQADRGAGTAANNGSYIQNVPAVVYANPHNSSVSIWAKSNTGINQSVYFRNAQGAGGTAITVTPSWQRFSFSGIINTTGDNLQIGSRGTANTTISIDILIYNGQLEIAAFPTSDIINEGSRLTRNADVATMTATNFSDWFNATKGTFRTDFISIATGNRPVFAVDDDSADEALIVKTQANAPTFEVIEGGGPQASVVAGTVTKNIAAFAYVSYELNFFGIARPTARQVDTSGTVPTVDRMRIGCDQAGNFFNGQIQKIQFWD
jgi:hypothetical protein